MGRKQFNPNEEYNNKIDNEKKSFNIRKNEEQIDEKNKKEYNNTNENFNIVLNGTKLYEIFNQKFLLFDEYINAGTIIRNFNGLVRLFNNRPDFKLSAFFNV